MSGSGVQRATVHQLAALCSKRPGASEAGFPVGGFPVGGVPVAGGQRLGSLPPRACARMPPMRLDGAPLGGVHRLAGLLPQAAAGDAV